MLRSRSSGNPGPALLLLAMLLAGCAAAPPAPLQDPCPSCTNPHRLLQSTLYQQAAAEYEATALSLYGAAYASLEVALATPGWTAAEEQRLGFESLPPAIVVDIDETVLDNSPYQARQLLAGADFDLASFDAWAEEGAARGIAGAAPYLQHAHARGVAIFYVSNRSPSTTQATLDNLRRAGFPDARPGQVLSRENGSDKSERRARIAASHRIVQIFGDNLGDFTDCYRKRVDADGRDRCTGLPAEGLSEVAARRLVVQGRADWWGRRWFMLPNPSYGSFEQAWFEFSVPPEPEERLRRARDWLDTIGDPPQ